MISKNSTEAKRKKCQKPHKSRFLTHFQKSGQQDLNLRPLGPQPSALPSYAIPRLSVLWPVLNRLPYYSRYFSF